MSVGRGLELVPAQIPISFHEMTLFTRKQTDFMIRDIPRKFPVFIWDSGQNPKCPWRDSNPNNGPILEREWPKNPGNSRLFDDYGCIRSRWFAHKCGQTVGKRLDYPSL